MTPTPAPSSCTPRWGRGAVGRPVHTVGMTLGELIAVLETAEPDLVLPLGFHNPHSYRGDYMDLAFEPAANVTVSAMLADARTALDNTYQGWKGGDYTMDAYTDCWLATQGSSADSETIGPILLFLLLSAGQLNAAARERLARFEPGQWRLG